MSERERDGHYVGESSVRPRRIFKTSPLRRVFCAATGGKQKTKKEKIISLHLDRSKRTKS